MPTLVHQENVESVVGSVFSTMLGLEACPSSMPCPPSNDLMTAAVYLTGEWQGAVCVHCASQQACDFAGRFMGMPTAPSVDDDVRDVMGELANMIAGNLKCTLSPGIRVSIPSVTDGTDYALRVCGSHVICRTGFQTEGGPVWITLLEGERGQATNAESFPKVH